jgi:heme/copper-type cytochrome/quinol oxidase subunit 2
MHVPRLIPLAIALLTALPLAAQVHEATPMPVLLDRLGVAHEHTGMAAMEGMQWDGSSVTSNAMPSLPATVMATAEAAAAAKTFTITARQFQFDVSPSPFVVNAGDDVTLTISVPSSDGSSVGHGFFLENYMTDQLPIARGKTVTVHFIASTPGTFTYLCTVTCGSGHTGMNGILTVAAAAARPAISAISPTSGPVSGGTPVTIGGSGFATGATVTIGGAAATGLNVVSATTITAKTPGTAPTEQIGFPKDVVVTNPDGSVATLSAAFTYTLPPLAVSSVEPAGAPPSGGATVTILGEGFTTAVNTVVTFGGVPATNVTVLGANAITVTAPPHATGAVDVVVTVGANSATLPKGFTYENAGGRRRSARK